MKSEYENEKVSKAKLQQDMLKLRAFYDNKLSNVDGQIAGLPPTAAGNSLMRNTAQFIQVITYRIRIYSHIQKTVRLPSLKLYTSCLLYLKI